MTVESFLIFLSITTVFMLSPGPSVALAIRNGAVHGARKAAIAIIGNVIAFQFWMLLSIVGLGAIIALSPVLFVLVKIAGAVYLIYLGIKMIISPVVKNQKEKFGSAPTESAPRLFWQAFLVTVSNPKAFIYISALLPQFVNDQDGSLLQLTIVAVSTAVVQFAIFIAYAALASKASRLVSDQRCRRFLNCAGGFTFIGFGASLGLAK